MTEPKCKDHPDAPHGFDRNSSHSEDRYVCECESWEPPMTEAKMPELPQVRVRMLSDLRTMDVWTESQVREFGAQCYAAGMERERERCAKLVEYWIGEVNSYAVRCAAAIRKGE